MPIINLKLQLCRQSNLTRTCHKMNALIITRETSLTMARWDMLCSVVVHGVDGLLNARAWLYSPTSHATNEVIKGRSRVSGRRSRRSRYSSPAGDPNDLRGDLLFMVPAQNIVARSPHSWLLDEIIRCELTPREMAAGVIWRDWRDWRDWCSGVANGRKASPYQFRHIISVLTTIITVRNLPKYYVSITMHLVQLEIILTRKLCYKTPWKCKWMFSIANCSLASYFEIEILFPMANKTPKKGHRVLLSCVNDWWSFRMSKHTRVSHFVFVWLGADDNLDKMMFTFSADEKDSGHRNKSLTPRKRNRLF